MPLTWHYKQLENSIVKTNTSVRKTHMFYTNEENKWFQLVVHLAFVAPFK